MDAVNLARALTSMTLGFHIIFATMGVGVPLMISLAEWVGIKRRDAHYLLLARRWTRGFVVSVAVGVVTGTCIGLQLSLLWPSFMRIAGQVISLPLFMETFAFFFEAIFLGIYLYTWDRFKKPIYHWLISLPVILGSIGSAFFISAVNAFMSAPRGFVLKNDRLVDIEPLVAMFNPATPTKAAHVIVSAILTSAFVLAAITAFAILKRGHHVYYRKALKLTMVAAFIFAVATVIVGDFSGKFLASYEPEKLAAGEWHFKTTAGADLKVFGVLTDQQDIKGALTIPFGLSLLAFDDPNAVVKGLDQYPKDLTPPLVIHYLFDGMVTIGLYLAAVAFVFVLFMRSKRFDLYRKKWYLWLVFLGGPLSLLAIELGWIFTEVGRQPWILYGVMKTSQGATTSPEVGPMFVLFFCLYAFLGVLFTFVMIKIFKDRPLEADLENSGTFTRD